jgi:UDP-N-acetylglucosamine diphosphorylase / glucose-1-phosphate thymidylyltransferase / UDP-N-acetylgalactosamine diphosphorylase / glucosamine-1-phosphate N-acetyltransferase / galactosamine-1-phosphate N-acetyltransferase
MRKIVFTDELYQSEKLYPFSLTRNILDIRIGILTLREKWEIYTRLPGASVKNPEILRIPVNLIPSLNFLDEIEHLENDFSGSNNNFRLLESAIQIFEFNDWAIRKDFELITSGRTSERLSGTNKAIDPENIFIEKGAVVEHCILNAGEGPVYIGKNSLIMEGAMIRGPFAICEGATVKMGTKIYGATTIGPYCIAGGEIKNSVLFGFSNKAHDGYLGDSVVGEWCNLGAGTSNSNIKNTAGKIRVWNNATREFETAGIKCGLLMGDYSRCAINTSFNTGTVAGVCCNIFGNFPPKYIPDFSWGNERYILEKALQDIDNWKKLKGKTITENEIKLLTDIYSSKKTNHA